MTDKAAELEKKLAALKSAYISQLGERIQNLETAFSEIDATKDFAGSKDGLTQLSFHAHKLSGTAGTFGFPELGDVGAKIEVQCDEFLESETTLSSEQKANLKEMVAACRALAEV